MSGRSPSLMQAETFATSAPRLTKSQPSRGTVEIQRVVAPNPTTKIAITKVFNRALILKKAKSLERAKRLGDHRAARSYVDRLKVNP
jgi:hypothetical protein